MRICYDFAMNTTLLAQWHSTAKTNTSAIVIPDGCRDLIMRVSPGEKPYWFLSSLDSRTYAVSVSAHVFMQGFRLKPGVRIDDERLLATVQHRHLEPKDLRCQIANFTHLSPLVAEALECLASGVSSVARASHELGVSQRSLQRLLMRETDRPPVYWLLLARVRKSARAALEPQPLAEVAFKHGYADQAHMSREFRRWLNVSPSKLQHGSDVVAQLTESGYG
jgi:AraC-like DNA-binding protein